MTGLASSKSVVRSIQKYELSIDERVNALGRICVVLGERLEDMMAYWTRAEEA